jgi:hypothetical protein
MIRLFHSEKQRGGDCCPEALIDGEWVEYSEHIGKGFEDKTCNWDDAVLLYESEEEPKIRRSFCGCCTECYMMDEYKGY